MSTRRARIKVAPNLSSSRSKNRTDNQTCKDHGVNAKIVQIQPVIKNGITKRNGLKSPLALTPTPSLLFQTKILTQQPPTHHVTNQPPAKPLTLPELITPSKPPNHLELQPPSQPELSEPPIQDSIPATQPSLVTPLTPPPTQHSTLDQETEPPSCTLSPEPQTTELLSSQSSQTSETSPLPAYQPVSVKEDAKSSSTGTFVNGKYISKVSVKEKEEVDTLKPVNSPQQNGKPASATMRKFLGRNKFKPNLFTRAKPTIEDATRRTRKSSVGDSSESNHVLRTRKISTGENNNEPEPETRCRKVSFSDRDEVYVEPRPALLKLNRKRLRSTSGSSSGDEINSQPNAAEITPEGLSPVQKSRTRRISESRQPLDKLNLGLKRRKVESKRRFSQGVPGRHKMTMFDLIYYNPDNGTEMVCDEVEPTESISRKIDLNESVDNPEPEKDEEDSLPVPQVKVGINGEIILDESSTVLETTAAKRAKEDLSQIPLVVENCNKFTNYGTWSKKRRYSDWSEKETFRFYRALSIVGSDFSMMESMFKKRTRQELKLKFKKEEKVNGQLVDKCLKQMGQYIDIEDFMGEDTEEEDEKVDRPERGRKRKGRLSARKKHSTRGHYESSSGGEEADVSETSRSPASRTRDNKNKSRKKIKVDPKPPKSLRVDPVVTPEVHTEIREPTITSLEKLPGVRFPPALLAANPGLAGAKPGSLVVVASPSKNDPNAQMLHVYMVSDKKKKENPLLTPRHSSPPPSRVRSLDPGRLSIDPAVVRAVDRKRTSAERTNRIADISPGSVYRRQRTLSEGTMISPSRLRTLSATIRDDTTLGETYTRTRKSGSSSELSTEVPGSSTATPGSSTATPGSSSSIPGSSSSIPGSRSSTPGSSSSIPGSSSSTPGLNEDPNAPIARKSKP